MKSYNIKDRGMMIFIIYIFLSVAAVSGWAVATIYSSKYDNEKEVNKAYEEYFNKINTALKINS